jgi:hypothetical protein
MGHSATLVSAIEMKIKRLEDTVDWAKDTSWWQHRKAAEQELAALKQSPVR